MKHFIVLLLFSFSAFLLAAQPGVGIGTSTPNNSALLDVNSTTKGLLIPRMTSAQRIAIASPAAGLVVYETTTNSMWVYNGSVWVQQAAGGTSPWTTSGTLIYNTNAGNVGIGTNSPSSKFHIAGNLMLENTSPIIQFRQSGDDKVYIQLSGDNLRLGTNSGNNLGKLVFRMDGSDKVFVDSTGNMQIIGEQDASLTTNGYLQLGSTGSTNLLLDNNEIVARNNGAADDLILQYDGGNVGIGIGQPNDKVDVDGSMRLSGSSRFLKFETGVAGGLITRYAPGIQFIRNDGTQLGKIEYVDTLGFANFMRFRMGASGNAIILNTSNEVGIGTVVPLGKFHVRGTAGSDEIVVNSGVLGETAAIQFYSSLLGGGANEKRAFVMLDDYDLKVGTNSGNINGRFVIRTDGADRMFVDEAGNVCIGTNAVASGYKLHVSGKAICEELKVQLVQNWPDYVFEKSYRLKPLDELKSFIETNKHLPGIPSAKEVEQNGLEVGEMQKKLMQKVEELSLYVIQLKEEIDLLKKSK